MIKSHKNMHDEINIFMKTNLNSEYYCHHSVRKLRMFEKKKSRKIFGSEEVEITKDWEI
jgi:hypothetical protein